MIKLFSTSTATVHNTFKKKIEIEMSLNPIVSTSNGPVQGIQKKSSLGYDYYSFQKIPYAKPPVGELRFSDPQPPIDCSNQGSAFCAMNNIINKVVGAEDSLHMNVFTKDVSLIFHTKFEQSIYKNIFEVNSS